MPEQGSDEDPQVSTSRQGYSAEFSTAMRGYDKEEVDAFLRALAEEHNRLVGELTAARRNAEKAHLALGEEMGELLQHAKDIADGIVKKAGEEASVTMDNARRSAETTVSEARARAAAISAKAEAAAVVRVRGAQQKVRTLQQLEAEVRSHLEALQHTARSLDSEIARTTAEPPIDQEVLDDAGEVAALTSPSG